MSFRLLAVGLLLALPFVCIAQAEEPKVEEGYASLFDGKTLDGWEGATNGYVVKDGAIVCDRAKGGLLYTAKEYGDFSLKFQFKLTPGANNGIGIRAPKGGDPAYVGMEIQVLDDSADKYKDLHDYQFHGSVYGICAAKRGHQKPVGEWNTEEIIAKGRNIKVILNGEVITDCDLDKLTQPKTADDKNHPGAAREAGRICFCGHGDEVWFKDIQVKELK